MSWSFELSLAAFLLVAFASQAVSSLTRSRLSLQLCLGLACALGFAAGLLPPDLAERSKLMGVGSIAFNLLMIHSGTMLDLRGLGAQWRAVAAACAGVLAVAAVVGLGFAPLVGAELALASPGPAVGGGAAAAIASVALSGSRPELAAYPWLLFMAQCLAGVPLCSWALGRQARRLAADPRTGAGAAPKPAGGPGPAALIPASWKGAAYYLGLLMILSVLNRLLCSVLAPGMGMASNVTAILLGMLLGRLGVLERDPLGKSDSMGLLMLGLMALMGGALGRTPPAALLALAPKALLVTAATAASLAAAGALAGGLLGLGAYGGIAAASACMVGLPLAASLARERATAAGRSEEERGALAARLLPPVAASAALAGNFLSIALASLAAALS